MANQKQPAVVTALNTSRVQQELSRDEKAVLLGISRELRNLHRLRQEAKINLDEAYVDWEKFDARPLKARLSNHAAELKKMVKSRDASAEAFDAASRAFDTRTAELLADPATATFVQDELDELEKAAAYQSSQARGEGTTYGSCPQEYLRYRLKQSSIVAKSGRGNPVFYPETVSKGLIEPEMFMKFILLGGGVNEHAVTAAMSAVKKELLRLTKMGFSINLFDMFTVMPTLRGTCTRAETEDAFHRSFTPFLGTRATPALMKAFRANLGARQLKSPAAGVFIADIWSANNIGGRADGLAFAPGALLRITGTKLDYNQAAEDEGFFLCRADGRGRALYKLANPGLGKDVQPSQATLFFPKEAVPGETLELVLRKRLRNSSVLRTHFYHGGAIAVE